MQVLQRIRKKIKKSYNLLLKSNLMKKLYRLLIPPAQWRLPVLILMGAWIGLILYALIESKAVSYLSENPKTETNELD